MRIVIYGIGAIGGTLATRLSLSGYEVVGIARGRQLDAIREGGLTLHTPDGPRTAKFPVHGDPTDIAFAPDDAVVLTMKGQDTGPALQRLQAAGVRGQPIFCFQNGVANEPLALRLFENVYGATVMLPADYTVPGEVAAYGRPKIGAFEIGRYPSGTDAVVDEICAALNGSGFAAAARQDVMASKYRKLLANLQNIVGVVFGHDALRRKWTGKLREEAETVLRAAGIKWDAEDAPVRDQMGMAPIPGRTRIGSSTLQSALRGTGALETDYLNGEIVLLGRLHNVPTPLNAAFCRLSPEIASGRLAPRTATEQTILALM